MNSLVILTLATLAALAYAVRVFQLDAAEARRRADRLEVRLESERRRRIDAEAHAEDAQLLFDMVARDAAMERHPSSVRHLSVIDGGSL